ncbi:MAG: hypothetical protein D3923_19635, partial [Candidatus Electrothrix sp. AR3]|nr:hypothetical protein [Candidatus Electrothrix sp. AR3]
RAEKQVDPGDWYFKAHFYSDPVQPGSLGVEAILQLIQLHMLHTGMADGLSNLCFEPCLLDRPTEWHYRGQVVPDDDKVIFDIEILERGRTDTGCYVEAEGRLWVNGKKIYQVPRIGMRLVGESAKAKQRRGLKKLLAVPSVQFGDFTVKVATKKRYLQEYITLYREIFVKEFQEPDYPVPNLEELSNTILLVGLVNDQVVGGLRIYPPHFGSFSCYNLYVLPNWQELRKFGRIGEITSLIVHPEKRGQVNFVHFWDYLKQLLILLEADYVLVSSYIKSKSYLLYASVGFKPIATPVYVHSSRGCQSQTAPLMPMFLPMIATLKKNKPLPPCALDVDLAEIDKLVNLKEK